MVRIYEPDPRPETLPALLWIHGGGYVLGNVQADDLLAKGMTLALNCVVASVEYRLAPEHPFPAPLEDCYAALKWLAGSADQLGINPARIAIGGASAGGGLAAGLGLLARDRAEVDVCYQLLVYPMIDDTNVEQAGPGVPDAPLWTRVNNLLGWRAYLGQEPGSEGVSAYAAPFRAEDVRGLPPTFIGVGTPDLFLDEDIAYAQRLIRSNVPTELHVYADGFHGFDQFAADTDTAQRFVGEYARLLKRALHE
jgi:acetyl esterase/lipase